MSELDSVILIGVIVAAVFGFLSFLNNVIMNLAVQGIKKRIHRILDRVEKSMDNPVDAFSPHLVKFIERLNSDKNLRESVTAALTFAARVGVGAAKQAIENPGDPKNPGAAPKPPRGILGSLVQGYAFLKQIGVVGGEGGKGLF